MSPGDLVVIEPVSPADLRPYRLFSILKREEDYWEGKWATLVDKLHAGEIGVVIQTDVDGDGTRKAQILSPRGKVGWTKCSHLRAICTK